MNQSRIRGFLLQQPKPTVCRVTVDGEIQDIDLKRSYAKVAETIEALGVELIECFSADGTLLRAVRVSSVEARRSDAADIPAGIAHDPHAMMLTHFANLVHRAYEHSTEIAFVKMGELFERLADRNEGVEARLERVEAHNRALRQEQIDDALDRAEEQAQPAPGIGDAIVQSFLGGQMQATVSKTPPAKTPNGKGHS